MKPKKLMIRSEKISTEDKEHQFKQAKSFGNKHYRFDRLQFQLLYQKLINSK